MRRLSLALGSLVLLTACGGGTTGSSPTSPTSTNPTPATPTSPTPTSPVPAAGWQGTLTAVRRTQTGVLDTTQTFEGTVSFDPGSIVDYEPPDLLQPLVQADATVYSLKPGLLRLTHTGSVGPCSYGTGTWDVLMKKSDGFMAVRPNGAVVGRVTLPDTSFPVTVTCPGVGAAAGSTGVQMDLVIGGTVAASRASGSMTPVTYSASTFSGFWNFVAR